MPKIEPRYLHSILEGAAKIRDILLKNPEYSNVELPQLTINEIQELDSNLWALIDFLESGDYKEFLSDEAIEKAAADAMDELEKNLAMEGGQE